MPEAAYCMECSTWVWVAQDGGCCNSHPRSALRSLYVAQTVSGVPVPPLPEPPAGMGSTFKSNDEFAIRPHRSAFSWLFRG